MRIHQQVVAQLRVGMVPGQVYFHYRIAVQRTQGFPGVKAQVVGRHVNVVHVQQQTAAGASRQGVQEIGFAPVVPGQHQVVRRVLYGHAPLQSLLQQVDAPRNARQCLVRAREGQQVGRVTPAQHRPRQVFRHQCGLQPVAQRGQPFQVRWVGFVRPRQGH